MKIKYYNTNFGDIINNKKIDQDISNVINNIPSLNIILEKNILEVTQTISNQFKKNKKKLLYLEQEGLI